MHYFKFNIGDYASHTKYLTQMQDLAYRRLLDLYYLQEIPLNQNANIVASDIGMSENLTDVEHVLNRFFTLVEQGWINKRADEEIEAYHKNNINASKAGKASAASRKAMKLKEIERTLNERCDSVQPTINHKPLNIKHKTLTKEENNTLKQKTLKPDSIPENLWSDFLSLRKTKKAPVTEAAISRIESEAVKAGWTLENALTECCARGWTGFKAEWVNKEKNKKPFQEFQETIGISKFFQQGEKS